MSTLSTLVMPKLGLTMTEGVVAEWRVPIGGSFKAGDVLAVVETDKIASELEAPAEGILKEMLAEAGQTVPVSAPIARWQALEGGSSHAESSVPAQIAAPPIAVARDVPAQQATPAAPPRARGAGARVIATPLARRMARDAGVKLDTIAGTGPNGRIKAVDIERASASPALLSAPEAPAIEPASMHAAAPFSLAMRARVGKLLDLHREFREPHAAGHITITHLVLLALCHAIRALRDIHAQIPARLSLPGDPDIGLSVITDAGQVTVALPKLDGMRLGEIAMRADAAIAAAREQRLTSDDQRPCQIILINVGTHGAVSVFPSLQPGAVACVGVGAVETCFRAAADGQPARRQELELTLCADPRALDGALALALLSEIRDRLEQPMRMLVE